LRYAEKRFVDAQAQLKSSGTGRRTVSPQSYQRLNVIYLPDSARFSYLLNLPEGENIGKAINEAMSAIEEANAELKGVLPRTYQRMPNFVLVEMLKLLSPLEIEGDAFGQIYEYFMGNFAIKTMQKGGEFYTPSSLVRLIVEIIEPYHGRIFDPACGSGGRGFKPLCSPIFTGSIGCPGSLSGYFQSHYGVLRSVKRGHLVSCYTGG